MPTCNLVQSTSFRLQAIPPYDFSLTVNKPAGWTLLAPSEIHEGETLWTAMRLESAGMVGLKLRSIGSVERPEVSCSIFSFEPLDSRERAEISSVVAWVLNVKEDIREFYGLVRLDRLVKALVEDLYGMRVTNRPDIFPRLILAVTLQMAPIRRSEQMRNLLIKKYGERIAFDGKEILYWPSPQAIAEATVAELQNCCKLGYRAKTLKGIAEAVSAGFPTLLELEKLSPEEAKAKVMELKGIGEYSADIVSLQGGFALDVWSARIFNVLLFGEKPISPRDVIPKLKKIAEERWGKWRGYVFTYVLNDLKNLSERFDFDLAEL